MATIRGTNDDDTLIGTSANDIIDSLAGNDTIDGGPGDDRINNPRGNDTFLFGKGDGKDTITSGTASINTLQFKEGVTVSDVTASRSHNDLVLNLAGTADSITLKLFFGNRDDAFPQLKFADGTIQEIKSIIANLSPNLIPTSADKAVSILEDNAYSLTSADFGFADGDSGDQLKTIQITSLPAAGSLTLSGTPVTAGLKISIATLNSNALVYVPEANGNGDNYASFDFKVSDGKDFSAASNHFSFNVTPTDDEEMLGTSGKDEIRAKSDNGVVINGLAGKDKLFGLGGNDQLFGGEGDDNLTGGAGNDLLDGNKSKDKMLGELGDDVYIVDHAKDVVIESANAGNDKIRAAVNFTLPKNVESLYLIDSSTAKNGTGNAQDNWLYGNQQANKLNGAAGNDLIFGYAGNDVLLGGAGNDDLIGGAGNDVLNGEKGNDTFWFAPGSGQDVIKNFGDKPGIEDVINLRDFSTSFDNLNIVGSGKNTVITIDGVDPTDFQIKLTGVKPVNVGADDFSFL